MIGRRSVVQTDNVARSGNMQSWSIYVRIALVVPFVALLCCPSTGSAEPLGAVERFAVLSAADTDSTIITADLGLSPNTSITGLESVALTGTGHQSEGTPSQAQVDPAGSYLTSSHLSSTSGLTRQNLGGLTLRSGIYDFSTSLHMAGTLTFDDLRDPNNAVFAFQTGSVLSTAGGSAIRRFGGENNRLSWQVGNSATRGTGPGPGLLDEAPGFGADLGPGVVADVPEPRTVSLFCVGFLALALCAWRSRKRVA